MKCRWAGETLRELSTFATEIARVVVLRLSSLENAVDFIFSATCEGFELYKLGVVGSLAKERYRLSVRLAVNRVTTQIMR